MHFQLEKGVPTWSMRRLVGETKVAFMAKRKVAARIPDACAAGLVGFIGTPDEQKLGIDFLGGTTMVVRTAEPQTPESMRGLFDPGTNPRLGQATNFTRSVEISAILNSAEGSGYTSFRLNSKGKSDGENLADTRTDVESWLQDVLSGGPVEDLTNADGAVSGVLYTEAEHSTTDLAEGLAKVGIEGATVTGGDRDLPLRGHDPRNLDRPGDRQPPPDRPRAVQGRRRQQLQPRLPHRRAQLGRGPGRQRAA